jgi:hypothetical protein
MKPLAVTFSHNWFSDTGWYNLQKSLDAGRRQLQALQERRVRDARLARPGLLRRARLRPGHLPRQRRRARRPAQPRRGLGLIRANDGVRPEGLDYDLKITGMTEEQFWATVE